MFLVIALGKVSHTEKTEIKHSSKLPVSLTKCKPSDGMRGTDAIRETGHWHCAGMGLLCLGLNWERVWGHSFKLQDSPFSHARVICYLQPRLDDSIRMI